jgi:hypothetical protein
MKFRAWFVCSIALFGPLAETAHAQAPHLNGLVLGISLEGDRYEADTLAMRQGAGLGALLGFGVTQNVAVLLEAGFAASGDGLSAHADIAARLNVPVTSSAAIYGQVAFAAHGREAAEDRMFLGDGLSIAAGTEIFFKPHRSIAISLTRWSGNYDELRPDGPKVDVDAESWRISIGMNLRPPR